MIETHGLSKTYTSKTGTVEAVRGVDLSVAPQQIVGFLGPNGAGKTTTQRMLSTLLTPSGGTATVAGHDLRREPVAVRRAVGYVAQGGSAYHGARVGEELVDQARLYGISRAEATASATRLLTTLDLSGLEDRPVRTLSGGQRRRLDIALGLVHDPSLLFLDEPSTGLDPQARTNLWEHIRSLRAAGRTVFLTTHYLDEADALCDWILVIDAGQIVAAGSPAELKRGAGSDTVTLTLRCAEDAARAERVLANCSAVMELRRTDAGISFQLTAAAASLSGALDVLAMAGVAPTSIEVRRPTLDEVFLSLTGCALRDQPVAA
jgi:ABC-2 type transport system ATP-binding protein